MKSHFGYKKIVTFLLKILTIIITVIITVIKIMIVIYIYIILNINDFFMTLRF